MSGKSVQLTDADFGYPAWRCFVSWLAKQPDERAQFTKETGSTYAASEEFILWASIRYGLEYCPPAIQAKANHLVHQEIPHDRT